MRAINLVPHEERRGAGGAAGRSGGAAYVVLGALAVVVLLFGLYTVAGRRIDEKTGRLASVEQQATATEAQAAQLAAYSQFAQLRASRVSTVRAIAESRFDWAHAIREVSRTVPSDVWLTALTATVAPGVPLQGSGASVPLRNALAVPAIELLGCTTGQAQVAGMMSALRQVDGVRRVTLQQSIKADAAAGGSGAGGGDCRNGSARYPQFQMVVFFDPRPAPALPAVATGATGPTGPTTPGGTP